MDIFSGGRGSSLKFWPKTVAGETINLQELCRHPSHFQTCLPLTTASKIFPSSFQCLKKVCCFISNLERIA
ncbi:hypothetical protein AQUCO_01300305v1 [Aquilegia coerulea]|uniref:Uncharacterized protein n=1 Tax=Aquilegia coerulea TaxID=218851 RepID=A0A2G5E0U2_AQUCA|nr:hypothetical protein AQUCO_01300305v1 [Aquilegia coerulea]